MNEFIKKAVRYPGHLARFARWKLGFCRRLRTHDPIFVYQMGKVASHSIYEALRRTYAGAVIHSHGFRPDYGQGEVEELYRYWNSRKPPRRMHVISMVRDPVTRNISAFFENFRKTAGVELEDLNCGVKELRELFLKKYPHDQPLTWFDTGMLRHFDIDVYATPFQPCGYARYEKGAIRLLVLRCELDDETKNKCVGDFLGMPDFRSVRANVGDIKSSYGELYRAFKEQVRLPREYVDRLCESKYFRHFYAPEFIESVRKRWSE